MRSKNKTFRIPLPLHELLEKRAAELGYPSANAYGVGLIRYDLLTARDHTTTVEISRQSENEQNLIDDEIAKMYATGEALKGSWFEAKLKEATELVAKGTGLPADKIVAALLERIKKR